MTKNVFWTLKNLVLPKTYDNLYFYSYTWYTNGSLKKFTKIQGKISTE